MLHAKFGVLGASLFAAAALAAPAQANLAAAGPLDPATTAPAFYQDTNGLQLADCPPGTANCGPAVPGESFWYQAGSTITQGAGVALLILNITSAPNADGHPASFQRIRLQLQGFPAGTYTITHPYGTDTVDVPAAGARGRNTIDIGCAVTAIGPCDFTLALGGRVGPFLTPAPGSITPPAGFISDGVSNTPVVGSPTGNNFFRIDSGPGIPAGGITETQFNVIGKLFGGVVPAFGSSGPVTFGTQLVNTPASKTITVSSNGVPGGGSNLSISNVAVTGPDAASYAVTGQTCTGPALPSGSSCTATVSFMPTSTGAKNAAITFTDNTAAGTHSVALSGTGGLPALSAPAALDFLNHNVSTTTAEHAVAIQNPGTVPLHVTGASISGPNAAEFAISSNTCATVAAGAGCTIGLKFLPATGGARAATLNIASDAPDGTHTVALAGTGTYLPGFEPRTSASTSSPLRVSNLFIHSRYKRATIRKRGLRVALRVPQGTGIVKLAIYRAVNGKAAGPALKTLVKLLSGETQLAITMNDATLRKQLRLGRYMLVVTPGTSSSALGVPARYAFQVIR